MLKFTNFKEKAQRLKTFGLSVFYNCKYYLASPKLASSIHLSLVLTSTR